MISIDDIVKKEFSRSFLGYDMREVDLFLDAIIEQLEADERERQEMLTAMEYLLRELEQFDDIAGDADRQLRESVEAVRRAAAPRTRAVHVNPVVPPADPAAEPAPEEAGEAVVLEEYEVYAAAPQDDTAAAAQASYAQDLETKLQTVLAKTEGVGNVEVMVTLEQQQETVYVTDRQTEADGSATVSHVLPGGSGLVQTVRMPQVLGVAVVCTGGGDVAVQNRVVALVQALTGVGANHITVAKMAPAQ